MSVAKAGIVCSLSARSAVIAAANPIGGHYNRAKTISENLKMSNAIMSRFDVIFILLDRPDEDRDHLLSEHVIALHRGTKEDEPSQRPGGSRIGRHNGHEHARTLAQRLELTAGQVRGRNETRRRAKILRYSHTHAQGTANSHSHAPATDTPSYTHTHALPSKLTADRRVAGNPRGGGLVKRARVLALWPRAC